MVAQSVFESFAVSHSAATNEATWKEALAVTTPPVNSYVLTKTLVFKPKVAKNEVPVLIMVVALSDTATTASQIAKAASVKEARFANAEAVTEALKVTVEQGIFIFFWLADTSVSSFHYY